MPKKKTGKKVYRKNRNSKDRNLLLIFGLVLSIFGIFATINQVQQNQTLQQRAETQTTAVTTPPWGCFGLGNVGCVANDTFLSDPANPLGKCLSIVKAGIEPKEAEQGQEVNAAITIKNTCPSASLPELTLKALHSTGKIIEFKEKITPQSLVTNQEVTFTTKYKIDPKELTGDWVATLWKYGEANGQQNQEKPFASESSNIKFTVKEPCAGLEVSKQIAVDKSHVNIGETIKASITYKNPCTSEYKVSDMLILVKKPTVGTANTFDDFGTRNGVVAYTFKPGEEKPVEQSMTIPPNPCEAGKPTCNWSALGAYIRGTDNKQVTDTETANFTVGAMDPVDRAKLTDGAAKPDANITRIPVGGTCDPSGTANKCADGSVCPKQAVNGKNTCVKQTSAGGVCDPKEGNLCASGYSCQKDTSSATGNKCLADKTTISPSVSKAPAAKPPAKLSQQIVYFDFNSSAIKSDYTADLQRVIDYMKANPTAKVTLEGHTDNVGQEAYNTNLGLQRANSVKTYLVGKGIAANRFTVISKGETQPLETNKTALGRYRNRRVEIF